MADEAAVDDGLADFRDIVEGIVNDVFACAQARDLDLTIGLFAEEINAAGYGPLFGAVQAMASRDMVLSMRKIFDDDKRFKQRTIPRALDWVEENEKVILDHPGIRRHFGGGCCGLSEEVRKVRCLLPRKREKTNKKEGVRQINECKCLSCSFDRVKTMADKEVAHNEVQNNWNRPEYRDIDRLIEDIVRPIFRDLFGPILNTSWVDLIAFVESSEMERGAKIASVCFRKLMVNKFGLSSEEAFHRKIV